MGGLFLLLVLCVIMALASFLAGALPLSMSLSQSQLRLVSSIGIGILVGTSLIVIIPEGIEALAPHGGGHSHTKRTLSSAIFSRSTAESLRREDIPSIQIWTRGEDSESIPLSAVSSSGREEGSSEKEMQGVHDHDHDHETKQETEGPATREESEIPTFYIGFSLIIGFILMFLIDRIPRHATESLQAAAPPREISLDNLSGGDAAPTDEEAAGFLGSLAPTPKQSRGLATTTGLVIHAAADGIAMGASSSTSNVKLGFIIFIAILIHKAPAAFGLTSVLLKQGLSKRAARGHLLIFSLAAPVGALGTWLLIALLGGGNLDGATGQWWTGMLLLFSAGTFLYVAMHAMQEDSASHDHAGSNGYGDGTVNQKKQVQPQMRDTLATVGGMLLPLLTQFGHHH